MVAVAKESLRAAIATLRDMVRVTGDHDTGKTSHAGMVRAGARPVN
jgi:hypothetical protein